MGVNRKQMSVQLEVNPKQLIATIRQSQDRLVALVQPLTTDQLQLKSYHSWTIAEVMSHLGSQAEFFDGLLTAALTGTQPPGPETMQPVWAAWAARSLDQQAADSIADNERLVARFEGLSDAELDSMHLNAFGMELDSTSLPRLRLAEHALHTWDIAVAVDASAQVAPDAVALLIDSLGQLVGRVGKPQGQSFRIRIRTTNPQRDFLLSVDEEVTLAEWNSSRDDQEMVMPAEAFLRLVYGRLGPEHTPDVKVTGSVTLDDVRTVFPGV